MALRKNHVVRRLRAVTHCVTKHGNGIGDQLSGNVVRHSTCIREVARMLETHVFVLREPTIGIRAAQDRRIEVVADADGECPVGMPRTKVERVAINTTITLHRSLAVDFAFSTGRK